MPRVMKEKQLPKTIEPAKWRDQVEAHIKETFPKEAVQGAVRFLKRPGIERAMEYLVLANSRQFERFDTDDGNGIDLCAIIRNCLEWGAYQPDPPAEVARARKMFKEAVYASYQQYLFDHVCELALSLASRKHGRIPAAGRQQLINALSFRMKEKFRGKPCYEAIALLAKVTFEPARKCDVRKEAAAVKRALMRMKGKAMIDFWIDGSDIVIVPSLRGILTVP